MGTNRKVEWGMKNGDKNKIDKDNEEQREVTELLIPQGKEVRESWVLLKIIL